MGESGTLRNSNAIVCSGFKVGHSMDCDRVDALAQMFESLKEWYPQRYAKIQDGIVTEGSASYHIRSPKCIEDNNVSPKPFWSACKFCWKSGTDLVNNTVKGIVRVSCLALLDARLSGNEEGHYASQICTEVPCRHSVSCTRLTHSVARAA